MGNSPDDGWIQRVTIEIPGPVASQEQWEAYKAAVHVVLEQFQRDDPCRGHRDRQHQETSLNGRGERSLPSGR